MNSKSGKSVGAAVKPRRRACRGKKIINPMVREKLMEPISYHVPPQERLMGSILRTLPRDVLKSYNFPFYREQLQAEMCKRVQLPPLAPLQPHYSSIEIHNQLHAAMVLEESRSIISEALFKRWGKDQVPSENTGLELDFISSAKLSINSQHEVYYFQARKAISPSIRANFRQATVVELMPIGRHSVEHIVLGSIVRSSPRNFYIEDDEDFDNERQFAVMVYNISGESFQNGVRLVELGSLLNLTRQFDACTSGKNSLNNEILGRQQSTELEMDYKESKERIGDKKIKLEDEGVVIIDKELLSCDKDDELEDVKLAESSYDVPQLNKTQKKAAKLFLNSSRQRISIIQGPPGTGKTTLILSVVCRYLLRAKDNSENARLLICAPTNKAVTVLATRVADAIRGDLDTNLVLIGDKTRLLEDNPATLRRFFVYSWKDEQVKDWQRFGKDYKAGRIHDKEAFRDCILKQIKVIKRQAAGLVDDDFQSILTKLATALKEFSELDQENSSLGRLLEKVVKELVKWDEREIVTTLLLEANIIFCTLASSGSQVMKETLAVDDVIVDEAAAATEPELCICLRLVKKRILLVGDPNQLPATVNSAFGKNNGLDISLQDRLMNKCDFPFTMLDVQYRMNEKISQFPLGKFYDGNIMNHEHVLAFSYQADATCLNGQPYALCQVKGSVQKNRFGSSYNVAECKTVVNLLQELRHRGQHLGPDWTNAKRVRVITFYQAQVNELRSHARRSGMQNVTISTVDSSQGCEADIIIISFVRGSDEKVGFLSDNRRLNVALTRAKHQLICVADCNMLKKIRSEKATTIVSLVKDAQERGCIVSAHEVPQGHSQDTRNKRQPHSRNQKKRKRQKNGTKQSKKVSVTSRPS